MESTDSDRSIGQASSADALVVGMPAVTTSKPTKFRTFLSSAIPVRQFSFADKLDDSPSCRAVQ